MADLIYMYNGLNFKTGTKEATYYDLTTNGMTNLANSPLFIKKFDDSMRETVIPTDSFNLAFNRQSTHQVLSAKSDFDAVIMGKVEYDKNSGKQAPVGYVRNQLKGLVYDAQRPIDLDNIMPIANNFYADSLNVLGNLN